MIKGSPVLSRVILLAAAAAAAAIYVRPVQAQSKFDSMQLAQSLGDMLASESLCGLHYIQPAIEAFISKRVRADDLEFNSMLTLMTAGADSQLQNLSASAKTAHCAQTSRVAKNYGFIP